jgi:hypothetical protein
MDAIASTRALIEMLLADILANIYQIGCMGSHSERKRVSIDFGME